MHGKCMVKLHEEERRRPLKQAREIVSQDSQNLDWIGVSGINYLEKHVTTIAQQSTSFNGIGRYKYINVRLGLSTLSLLHNAALLVCAVITRRTKAQIQEELELISDLMRKNEEIREKRVGQL
jgi:hypothetical protein